MRLQLVVSDIWAYTWESQKIQSYYLGLCPVAHRSSSIGDSNKRETARLLGVFAPFWRLNYTPAAGTSIVSPRLDPYFA